MTPDEKATIYNNGFKAGAEHTIPSTETEKKLKVLKEYMDDFKTEIKADIKDLVEEIKTLPEKMLKFADEKYASKLSLEKVRSRTGIYSILVPLLMAIIGFLVSRFF